MLRYFFMIIGIVICVILDLWSKSFFQVILKNNSLILWKEVELKLAFNTGIAFSLPLHGFLQVGVTIILLGILCFYFFRHYTNLPFFPTLGFIFIISGALGNLYERLFELRVTDFIQIFSWFPIFNFADIFIFIGICIFFIAEWKQSTI